MKTDFRVSLLKAYEDRAYPIEAPAAPLSH